MYCSFKRPSSRRECSSSLLGTFTSLRTNLPLFLKDLKHTQGFPFLAIEDIGGGISSPVILDILGSPLDKYALNVCFASYRNSFDLCLMMFLLEITGLLKSFLLLIEEISTSSQLSSPRFSVHIDKLSELKEKCLRTFG